MASGIKILHVNTLDQGGAANSCVRLHKSLLDRGINSTLLVRKKTKNTIANSVAFVPSSKLARFFRKVNSILFQFGLVCDPSRSRLERAQLRFKKRLPKGSEYFSFPTSSADITTLPQYEHADIIHLHWVADFLDYPTFFKKNKKPVVWTLHDMAPFQGGNHYEEKFLGIDDAGEPAKNTLSASIQNTLRENLRIKRDAIKSVDTIHVVAPSIWLTNASGQSDLFGKFPHHTIPYGLDTTVFKPRDKNYSRELLDIPRDKICLLFVADNLNNYRKGFGFLQRALNQISSKSIALCAIGHKSSEMDTDNFKLLGRIEDERMMSVAYSAADAFIIPSVEDNLPNTVLESLLCGTPVIGFPVGGIPDMVQDGQNGLLSQEISVSGLQKAIERFISMNKNFDREIIRKNAVEKYDLAIQAEAYIGLYTEIMKAKK